jgi:N-carbamoylputrescine amidase
MLKLGLIQMRCSIDPRENVDKAEAMIRTAAAAGANIICLQEIFNTIYFCQTEDHAYFRFAEEIPGPTTKRLGKVAENLGIVIVVPIFERRAAGLYHNSAAVIDADGSFLGSYRKMHIPDDPLFYEKFYFTPGGSGV